MDSTTSFDLADLFGVFVVVLLYEIDTALTGIPFGIPVRGGVAIGFGAVGLEVLNAR